MTDRIPLDHLTSDQYDQLCDRLQRAEAALARVRDAAHLHRQTLISNGELYAVIGPTDGPRAVAHDLTTALRERRPAPEVTARPDREPCAPHPEGAECPCVTGCGCCKVEGAVCDTYQPPTSPEGSGLCARCGMFDYRHQAEPETCCVCGGGPVTYHNYREQPFCWPCADCGCGQEPCVRKNAEARLAHLQATSEAAGRLLTRTTDERDQLAAAVARVRTLATATRDATAAGRNDWQIGQHDCALTILAALDKPTNPATAEAAGHVYLSTSCYHGDHTYCQAMTGLNGAKRPGECKHCGTKCICRCHTQTAPAGPIVDRPFRTHRQPTTTKEN